MNLHVEYEARHKISAFQTLLRAKIRHNKYLYQDNLLSYEFEHHHPK